MISQVFISFKNTDEKGEFTPDKAIAEALYKAFMNRGISCFYSNVRLLEFGEAAYKQAIEKALDEATVLVLVGTKLEYIESRWLQYEWDSFHEDILANTKSRACIVPFLKGIERASKPRALRNYQTFDIDNNSVEDVVEFVYNFLHPESKHSETASTERISLLPASSYKPDYADEANRLYTQAQNTRPADIPAIEYCLKALGKESVYVLDLGCAYGYVTEDRFGSLSNVKVLAVDISQKCIDFASQRASANIVYEKLNLEAVDMPAQLAALMQKHGIPRFDIIFGSLILLHLAAPVKVLRNLRSALSDDGYLIIRGSDDDSTLSYNDDGLIEKIISLHHATKGISDRGNGKKLYYQLYTSGYRRIRMFNYVKEISSSSFEERLGCFRERFAYRRNYLQMQLDKEPFNMNYRNDLELIDYALMQLEDKFGDPSFWYCEIDFVAVAQKATN